VETILFSHIPKTAGSSLTQVIEAEYTPEERTAVYAGELRLAAPDSNFLNSFLQNPVAPKIVYGHFSYGVHEVLGLRPRYFSFLREPVVRIESLYDQLGKPDSQFFGAIRDGLSLAELIEQKLTEMTNNHMTRVISGIPAQPGSLVTDSRHLEAAIKNIERDYFFLGTVESAAKDFSALADTLGWKTSEMPHLNASTTVRPRCDENTRSLIVEHNQLDIALYQWAKGREPKR